MARAKGLAMGKGLTLPLDAASSSYAILGSAGSGKSNTAVRLFEQLVRNGVPAVAIDPKGDWHGIRTSADGKGPGLAVPIFGGLRADEGINLEAGMGHRLAELLFEHALSALLDVSRMSHSARARFLIDFLHRLYELHQAEPTVRHVVVEEAHRLVPQQVSRETGPLKEAVATIVLDGRSFGFGFCAASQRPARLHNDVLEEVWNLIVHNTRGTADRTAVRGWVTDDYLALEVYKTLPHLGLGEAWVYSPKYLGIQGRYQMHRRETLDTGATPKVGEARVTARTKADVDMAAIKEALADVVERAVANDPAALRRRIAELERQLRDHSAPEPVVQKVEVPVEVPVPVLDEDLVRRVEEAMDGPVKLLMELQEMAGRHRIALERGDLRPPPPKLRAVPAVRDRHDPEAAKAARSQPRERQAPAAGDPTALNDGDRAVLAVLAAFPAGRSPKQVAILTGQAMGGGAFQRRMRKLRDGGYLMTGNPLVATPAGLREGSAFEDPPPPPGRALVAYWQEKVGAGAGRVLGVLADVYPGEITRVDLAAAAGLEFGAGAWTRAWSKVRALDLVEDGEAKGHVRLSPDLMAS